MTRVLCLIACMLGSPAALQAGGPKVHIVVGPQAPKLEQFAAQELAAQFQQLFDAAVSVSDRTPANAAHLILLGSPATNPELQKRAGATWPKLSDQGHLLRSSGNALIVGGGSPVATLWAIYELGHRFGMRYTLHGDVPPAVPPTLKLTGFDVILEPNLRLRTWRTISDFPTGPESWGLADQKKLLGQLAKLKFNRILLAVHPWQAFAHYEFKGVPKQTGLLWFGYRYPVGGDTAGRAAFRGATEFTNPDFAAATTYPERVKAATSLARGIIDAAHDLGMSAGLSFSPLEFPREFAALLPNASPLPGPEKLTIGPGPLQPPDDPVLQDLAATQLRTYLDTYPALDAVYLTLPSLPAWSGQHAKAWQRLNEKTGAGEGVKLEDLTEAARRRPLAASGERGVQALQGGIVSLAFLHDLLRKDVRKIETNVVGVDPALFPILERVLPAGTGALHVVDYSARRVAASKLLPEVPAAKVPSSLILTLSDDNLGVLPQLTTRSLQPLLELLQHRGWQGFSTRYWVPGDLSPAVHYLARAAFDPKLTPQAAYEDFIEPIGGEGVSPVLIKAFNMIETATDTIEQNDRSFSVPVPGMVLQYYTAEPVPPWWKTVRDLYAGAMDEVYRASTRARDGVKARPLLHYYAKRLEFAFFYMNSLEALRLAGQAKAKGDFKAQREQLEAAVEAMYNGLGAYGEVARDPSDRGVIAVLNEYGYRPLRRELAVLKKAARP